MIRGSSTTLVIELKGIEDTPSQVDFVFKRLPFETETTLLKYTYPNDDNITFEDGKYHVLVSADDTYKLPYDEAYVDIKLTLADGRNVVANEPAILPIKHSLFDKEAE